jgi:hypothetical protein
MGLPATASVVRRSIPPCHGRGTPYRGDSDRKRGFRPLRRRHGFKSRGRRSGRIGREWKQAVAEQLVHEASRDGTHTRVHVAKSTCTTVRAEVRNGCGCKPHNRQCQSVRTDSTSRVALSPAGGDDHSVRARPCAQYRGDFAETLRSLRSERVVRSRLVKTVGRSHTSNGKPYTALMQFVSHVGSPLVRPRWVHSLPTARGSCRGGPTRTIPRCYRGDDGSSPSHDVMKEYIPVATLASGATLGLVYLWLKASADRARSRARWLQEFYSK